MAKAYVLLSGGIDSSTCLALACHGYGNDHVKGISVNYGQRHTKELKHAGRVAKELGTEFDTIDMGTIMGMGGLTDPAMDIPDKSYAELGEGVSPTYVPFRNALLLSAITSIAQADGEAEAVYYGAHAEDAENWAYPDCTPEFIGAMANAICMGTYHQIRLHTPLMWLTKAGVITAGDRVGVPWDLTWSCYKGEVWHCGTCPTCISRREAFLKAGVEDPTIYQSNLDQ